jgi:hypothetical protein
MKLSFMNWWSLVERLLLIAERLMVLVGTKSKMGGKRS